MHWLPSKVLRLPGPKNALTQRQSKQLGRVVEKEPVLQAAVELLTLEGLTVDQVHELGQQVQEVELLDDDAEAVAVKQEPGAGNKLRPGAKVEPGAGVAMKQEKQEPEARRGVSSRQGPKPPLSPKFHKVPRRGSTQNSEVPEVFKAP